MEKQEVIKKAYGDFYDKVKDRIDVDGCISLKGSVNNEDANMVCKLGMYSDKDHKYKPINLKGIETNNNWTKIYSKKDLPIDNKFIYWYKKGLKSKQHSPVSLTKLRFVYFVSNLFNPITHYCYDFKHI